jgi:hypothetical protein
LGIKALIKDFAGESQKTHSRIKNRTNEMQAMISWLLTFFPNSIPVDGQNNRNLRTKVLSMAESPYNATLWNK